MDDRRTDAVTSLFGQALLPAAIASTSLRSLGHWPRYVSSANVMAHLPFIAWCTENVPNSSVLAIGGEVETGYFSICQALGLSEGDASCTAIGRWQSDDGSVAVPEHVRWHNDLHYRGRGSIAAAESTYATLEVVRSRSHDIVFCEMEGTCRADVELDSLFQSLRGQRSVVLLNLPSSSEEKRRAAEAWSRHLDPGRFAFLSGPSTLMVGVVGAEVPPALAPALSDQGGRVGVPSDVQGLFRALGQRNLWLVAHEAARAKASERPERITATQRRSRPRPDSELPKPTADGLLTTVLEIAEAERRRLTDIFTAQIDELRSALAAGSSPDQRAQTTSGQRTDPSMTIMAGLEAQLTEAVGALADERTTRFTETATLTRMLETQRHHAEELDLAAAKRAKQLRTLRVEKLRAESDAATQAQLLRERASEVARLEHQLQAMRSSRSWRITAPLRFLQRAFKSISHRR